MFKTSYDATHAVHLLMETFSVNMPVILEQSVLTTKDPDCNSHSAALARLPPILGYNVDAGRSPTLIGHAPLT
jgi:hypothetical protein